MKAFKAWFYYWFIDDGQNHNCYCGDPMCTHIQENN